MKYRYSKFRPEDLDGLDLEELLSKLSDLLLSSGFDNPYGSPYDDEDGVSAEALHDAIMEALLNGGLMSDEMLEQLLGKDWQNAEDAEERIEQLIQQILQKLQHQGYLTGPPNLDAARAERNRPGPGGRGPETNFKFEITDKSLDFLGYRALRDLLGSIGRSSVGRHDTREMATGIEASGAPKRYEFGDTMNIDAGGTILNAVMRSREKATVASVPFTIDVDYEDLMVVQGEYQSSCATVLMLDCSHSMILYGEDRFTPAKRVALALANLIRLQYPGDALNVVLFHDSAEEIPLSRLARVEPIMEEPTPADRAIIREERRRLEALLVPQPQGRGVDPKVPPSMADEDLVNALAQYLDLEPVEKQALLERDGLVERCRSLIDLLEMKVITAHRTWNAGSH